jgi:hypothetical protein
MMPVGMMPVGIMPVGVMPVPSARSTRPCRISIVGRSARRAEREGSEGLRKMHRWLAVLTSHDDGSGAATLLAQDKRVNASRMPIRTAFVDKITPVRRLVFGHKSDGCPTPICCWHRIGSSSCRRFGFRPSESLIWMAPLFRL